MSWTLAEIKPGSTFQAYVDYASEGVPETFPVTDLTSQVRDRDDNLLTSLTIFADETVAGRYHVMASAAQTLTWPLGEVRMDIKRSTGGVVSHTRTATIPVVKAQTP